MVLSLLLSSLNRSLSSVCLCCLESSPQLFQCNSHFTFSNLFSWKTHAHNHSKHFVRNSSRSRDEATVSSYSLLLPKGYSTFFNLQTQSCKSMRYDVPSIRIYKYFLSFNNPELRDWAVEDYGNSEAKIYK